MRRRSLAECAWKSARAMGGLLAVGLAACAAQHQAPVPPTAPAVSPLLEGSSAPPKDAESFEAEVTMLGLPLASMRSVTCPTAGSASVQRTRVTPAALVRVIQRSGGSATTELSAEAGESQLSEYFFEEGNALRRYQVSYEPGRYDWTYEFAGKTLQGQFAVPEGAHPHDFHSALSLLRGWHARKGDRGHFYVVMGRKLWRVEVEARGPEMVRLGDSSRLSWRVDGEASALWRVPEGSTKRRFSLWLDQDASRIPLRLQADAVPAPVTLDLTGWANGQHQCADTATLRTARSATIE